MISTILYQYLKIHKIDYEYEFMDKMGKERCGIVREVDIRISGGHTSIVYIVEHENEFLNVGHDTNREL